MRRDLITDSLGPNGFSLKASFAAASYSASVIRPRLAACAPSEAVARVEGCAPSGAAAVGISTPSVPIVAASPPMNCRRETVIPIEASRSCAVYLSEAPQAP